MCQYYLVPVKKKNFFKTIIIRNRTCINKTKLFFFFYVELQDTASSSEVAMPGAMDTEMPDAADAHPSQQMLLHRQQQEMQARPDHEPVIMLDITETPDPEIEDYLFDFYYRKKVYEQNATSLVVNNQQ